MPVLVDLIVPIFGLILFGYAATFTPVFDQTAGRALAAFVFWFAIPVMLFRNMAGQQLPAALPWGYLLSYYLSALLVFALGMAASRLLFAAKLEEQAIMGFGGSYGNVVLMGTPLVLAAFGPQATLPFFLILSFHSVLMFTVVTVVVELGQGGGSELRQLPKRVGQGLVKNPILVALGGGLVFHWLGLSLPHAVDRWAELVGEAAGPCALFSMGASLRAYRIGGAMSRAAAMMALKLLLLPLLVWLLATRVFTVDPAWVPVAVITAAMPCGVNSYLFAERYKVGQAESAAAILVSTGLSVVTMSLILGWLG
ncbi:MAG TPA: AEC family transporter [Geminicoccaceae bacterium]|nr:AEC family transporter [Geminicoccus sp.]HMU51090.1 AEC family transporter [Geminicoccaceae bacterium]